MMGVGTVLLTNASGTIAQAAARIIRSHFPSQDEVRLLGIQFPGFSTARFSLDQVVDQPRGYSESSGIDENWLEALCKSEGVSLIVPCTDYEPARMGDELRNRLPTVGAVRSDVAMIFYDKLATAEFFRSHNIPFATTYKPSEFDETLCKNGWIAKPRFGGLSNGIMANCRFVRSLPDSEFIVQSFLNEPEVSWSFYVTKSQELFGPIVFEREVRYGMSIVARTAQTLLREQATVIANAMMKACYIVGPCNVQGRIDESGRLVPFEVNCRLSGSVSFRAAFGFADPAYLVAEYIMGQHPEPPTIVEGAAFRIIRDVFTGTNGPDGIPRDALGSSQFSLDLRTEG